MSEQGKITLVVLGVRMGNPNFSWVKISLFRGTSP